ncbi:cell wall-binding protein [Lysinibacillus sp. PLM2]|nr:cell wall-binding protein [Lysinibacillus sp. PLM2]
MANQPKKYKKFVASAATATLVASAIVPVASAATPSDIAGNDHEQNIKDLLELGYVSGKADGSFAPNEAVTRGQVVLMLGKWAEAQGIEVPADYLEKEYFTDYPSYLTDDNKKYYALVKAAGIFEGYADGSLKPGQNISRVQMAVVLNSAYEAVTGKSLVELAGDTSDVVVNDIDAVYADYQPAVLAMKKLGITAVSNYNPSGTVTRGQFASFLNATIKAEAPAGEAGEIKSLTATGVSELTVEFDGAVDPEAVEFALTRGTTSIDVSAVNWNENNTAAVLKVDTKFVDATYTLTVNGLGEEAATATVTTTREVATSIEFLSNALTLTGKEEVVSSGDAASLVAKITFEVYNQYGEDITDNIATSKFEAELSGIKEDKIQVTDKGVITAWVDEDEDEGQEGSIELKFEDGDIEIDVDHDVVLSDESEPGEVEFLSIYNEFDEALTTDNVEDSEEYYALISLKDQYGVEIDPEDAYTNDELLDNVKDGLKIDVSDNDIFEMDEDNITILSIDGDRYFAIPLEFDTSDIAKEEVKAGENTITIKATANGFETSEVIAVEDSGDVVKIDLSSPEDVVAAEEEVKLPVYAYDQNGDLVTNVAKLNKLKTGDKITISGDDLRETDFSFEEENGQVYLVFTTPEHPDNKRSNGSEILPNESGYEDEAYELDIEIEVEDYEDSEITLNVEPKAYPATLVRLNSDVSTSIFQGTTIDFDFEDFVIEDQYGRVFEDVNGAEVELSFETNDDSEFTVTKDSTTFYVTAPSGKKSETVTFKLKSLPDSNGTAYEYSELDVTFRSVEEEEYDSYEVEAEELVYGADASIAENNYKSRVKVYGVNGNQRVLLPYGAYYIVTNSKLATFDENSKTYVYATESAVADLTTDDTSDIKSSFETAFKVVINKTGEEIAKAVTVSEDDPTATTFSITKNVSGAELTSLDITVSEAANLAETLSDLIFVNGSSDYDYEVEDQYANDTAVIDFVGDELVAEYADGTSSDKVRLTVSNVNDTDDDYTLLGNGTTKASLTDIESGSSFTLTLNIDGVTKTLKVNVE